MKLLRHLLFLLAAVLSGSVFSQNHLSIQLATGSVIPPTADTGTNFSFNVWIINLDTPTYSAPIEFGYAIDTFTYAGSSAFSGLQYDSSTVTIPVGDTATKTITVNINQPVFNVGPSVVVIWPLPLGGVPQDSIIISFTVTLQSSGIDEANHEKLQLCLIGNALHIEKDAGIQLRQVRIYDITGRNIAEQTNPSNNIPLPEMNTGIYFAEITYNQNQRKIFRFYK